MKRPAYLIWLAACAGLHVCPAREASPEPSGGHVFAWPFMDWKEMRPRGGTTQGAEVALFEGAKDSWRALQEPELEKFEKDRRAILAMAGNYRVSFDFTETLGLAADFKPTRPYFSWATENVTLLEDRGEFISLQHTLVMYFRGEDGEAGGPHVMKHWRQDWTWQDAEMYVYQGDLTWRKSPVREPGGRWTQAVFQVDDSPRYEVAGEWTHDGGMSTWRSDLCPRPLPRREFSIRKDYNILEGYHEITLTPNGWVHVQNNRKLQVDQDGSRRYLGQEIGVNRYEEIASPELAPAFEDYWAKTGGYWEDVRETWADLFRGREQIAMKESDEGEKLFAIHFEHAAKLEKGVEIEPGANLEHARETIRRFVKP